jgi:hypothetical protein
MNKRGDEIKGVLREEYLKTAPELVHRIAVSLASYIAAIDSDSNKVAAYLERRLEPLIGLIRTDERVRQALERIANDGRKPEGEKGDD